MGSLLEGFMEYTELQITSNFSFLRGGSHPEELVEQALALGYTEIAITDYNTLAGVVRAYSAAKDKNIRIIPGCRLELLDGHSLLAYPKTKEGYANLSGLLSVGNLRAEKGKCFLHKQDVYQFAKDLLFVMVPPQSLNAAFGIEESFKQSIEEYKQQLGESFYLGITRSYHANDNKKLFRLSELSKLYSVPLIAMNDVHYHAPARRELQDVLTCIREKCTITTAGFKLYQNAERYLKTADEMKRLFAQYPEAIANTKIIADACLFSLGELKYSYPKGLTTEGRTHQEELAHHTWIGAHKQFGETLPEKVKQSIEFELAFIERKDLSYYFLTVHDYVWEARRLGILCQGRGSAANSVVCYSLGITSVDPTKHRLLFSRFMSDARDEPPDIDVDFEHDRREEIIQYIYKKYGREHAAIVATVTQVHYKGAVRDVGKAMGLSLDAIDGLASSGWELTQEWLEGKQKSSSGFNAKDPHLLKVLNLTNQYRGFPRQLGQHTGGFVLTHGKISDLCPTLNARMENRTNIEWNKDDIESLGILKVDVLGLGMLTCIRKCFDLAKLHYDVDLTLANIKQDEAEVYDMICRADTIGVFQIESRAQMSMSPRLRPRKFYDLVIQIAIVRPGPIQGGAVNPYIRRRNGEEEVHYPSTELEKVLERTLGVVLFQEQAMEVAIVAAGFTPTEADQLRRSMASFKADGKVGLFEEKLVKGMTAKGYTEEYSRNIFKQLKGFSGYGFPESHSSSFALLAYVSAWLKCYYPDVFAAGLLNSQPMGFYQPAQIISCAKNHGVTVRAVDINFSYWDNTLEEKTGKYHALRLGFREVKGLREEEMQLLVAFRESIDSRQKAGVSEQFSEGSEQGAKGSEQWAVGSEHFSVSSYQNAEGGDHETVGSKQLSVSSEQDAEKETRDKSQEPETRNKKSETRNQKQETRNQKPETRNKKQGTRNASTASRIEKLLHAGISIASLELLANADAFRSLGIDRRKALWEISALKDHHTGLFAGQAIDNSGEINIQLPEMSLSQHVMEDYKSVGLSLKAHPVSFIRHKLSTLHVVANQELPNRNDGTFIKVAGLVLVRQRPGTASGICFITLEDETGIANLVVFEKLFTRYRKEIVHSRFLMVEGTLQKEKEVIHVIVSRCYDLTGLLMPLGNTEANGSEDQSEIDRQSRYPGAEKELVKSNNGASFQYDVFHGGRNFH